LVFPLGSGLVAVMEINQDLDSTLSMTEDFVRGSIEQLGRRVLRAGIASRNGRLIGAESLYNEAENALNRTDDEKNIVAFRSDPEKYRAFLKSQEN
jgi:predicted metal-dependent hydrolase